jgi:hypothetical protein
MSKKKLHIECPPVDNLSPTMINDSMLSNVTGEFQNNTSHAKTKIPSFLKGGIGGFVRLSKIPLDPPLQKGEMYSAES